MMISHQRIYALRLKEPPPEKSCTCRFAAQGHPDYLTACAISKAIHFLVIKPVPSCLLQLSGKEYKKMVLVIQPMKTERRMSHHS